MRVANAIEEEVEVGAVVVDDRKLACDICGKILCISATFIIKLSYLG